MSGKQITVLDKVIMTENVGLSRLAARVIVKRLQFNILG